MSNDWIPQPKQEFALSRTEKEVLYGGSRGGGKTEAGLAMPLYNIDKSNFRCLVVRRNAEDLKDWVDRAEIFYKKYGKGVKVGNPAEIHFPSGAKIRTGHLKDSSAYTKYQGHEYQLIIIEEITHIPREGDYEALMGSCRSTDKRIKPQIFCTTNPDGPGHSWIKKRWKIGVNPSEVPFDGGNGTKRIFIPATVEDNPILMKSDPGYLKYLDGIKDEDLRNAWRYGSWDGFGDKNTYYGKLILQAEKAGRITSISYDDILPVNTAWDIGVGDSTSIWFYQIYGNEIRLIDYYENNGEGMSHYINVLKDKVYRYGEHYAPHDIRVTEFSSGKTRLQTALELGINFNVIPKTPIEDGIEAVRRILGRCWFDNDKCEYGIEALKHYKKDYNEKLNVERSKPLHDWSSHCADSFRYLAQSVRDTLDNRVEIIDSNDDYDPYGI